MNVNTKMNTDVKVENKVNLSAFHKQQLTNARLACVQALYQLGFEQKNPDEIMIGFLSGRMGDEVIEENPETGEESFVGITPFDEDLFRNLFRYAVENMADIDGIIEANLDGKSWSMGKLEAVLKAILQAGIAELYVNDETDVPVIINEYIDLANSFYEGGAETSLTNAMLDKIAKVIRGKES